MEDNVIKRITTRIYETKQKRRDKIIERLKELNLEPDIDHEQYNALLNNIINEDKIIARRMSLRY
jgi:hypothetical protein